MAFPILKASSRITARLNYLCPQFFPAPGFWPSQLADMSMIDSTPWNKVAYCFSHIKLIYKFDLSKFN